MRIIITNPWDNNLSCITIEHTTEPSKIFL